MLLVECLEIGGMNQDPRTFSFTVTPYLFVLLNQNFSAEGTVSSVLSYQIA